jgi:acetyl xylan esterase
MIFHTGERIVFIGDSVTEYGHGKPVGEGLFEGVGTGYVRVIENFINIFYPERTIRISNTGISGNNILDLKNRWDTDLLALRPDWVSICIGINDVWRQFDSPALKEQHVAPDVYERTYRELIERTLPCVKGIILMTPYYIEIQREDPMRKRMDEYTEITKKLAEEYGLRCVDLQKAFDDFLQFRHSSFLAWDRIHPNQAGCTLMGVEFLRETGFDFSRMIEAKQK